MVLSPLGTDEVVPATFPVSTIIEAANSSQLVMLKNVKQSKTGCFPPQQRWLHLGRVGRALPSHLIKSLCWFPVDLEPMLHFSETQRQIWRNWCPQQLIFPKSLSLLELPRPPRILALEPGSIYSLFEVAQYVGMFRCVPGRGGPQNSQPGSLVLCEAQRGSSTAL